MDTWYERMRTAREKLELSKTAFAKLVGVSQPTVTDWESGVMQPNGKNLLNASRVLGMTPDELLTGKTGGAKSNAELSGQAVSISVPVVGTLQGGTDGYLAYDQTDLDGIVTHYSDDPGAYAMRIRGDSMAPRIRHGEFVVVEPCREAMPGDDVAVELRNGRRVVKTFLYERDGEITLGSINNGHGNITVNRADVVTMLPVVAILPRMAFRDQG